MPDDVHPAPVRRYHSTFRFPIRGADAHHAPGDSKALSAPGLDSQ